MGLKFLQIGLGSMGKRRIRCLLFHGILKENIFGFDLSKERCDEVKEKYGVEGYTDLDLLEKEKNPDVYIISTPPNLHHEYFLRAAKKKKHFFVEVTTVDNGYDELYPLLDDSFVAAPSHTFRYFPAIKKIKEIVQNGKIGKLLSFQYHLGQYLPDWHPWEDYRDVYFSKKETGACREMFVFELIWLTDILKAPVSTIKGFVDKVSDLEMSADDIYSAVMRFENGIIGNVTIDVLSRAPFRTLRLVGSKGVLEWEWMDYEIRIYSSISKKWETISLKKGQSEESYLATEDMYREEIKFFLDAINGGDTYPYTFKEDHAILKSLYALEENDKSGKKIKL